jgi:putative ABC transport system substrate-binding protein
LAASSLALAGCGQASTEPTAGASDGQSDQVVIGVAVYVAHPSLQLIRDGFTDYLEEQGVRATYKDSNAQADAANVATIATTLAADADLDLILAITTPIAQGIVAQVTDIPVVYAGVTDPAYAGLVQDNEGLTGTNVTGVSDLNPEAKPVALIQEIMPEVKTVGALYSSSEANSLVQVESFEAEAEDLGITIKRVAVTNTNEIATAVATMTDVDAILIPTDNTVVAGIEPVIAFGQNNHIPVFTIDAETLSKGALASRGLSYYQHGREAGRMAWEILVEGTPAGQVPTVVSRETQLYLNPDAATAFGVTLPANLLAEAQIVATTG